MTQNMINYEFGDVVLVSFPFTDQSLNKKRPAIVVSSNNYNKKRPDIILMAATSHIKSSKSFGEVSILKWKEAGFIKPSVIKPIFTTIDKKLIIKKLGKLRTEDRHHLHEIFKILMGE